MNWYKLIFKFGTLRKLWVYYNWTRYTKKVVTKYERKLNFLLQSPESKYIPKDVIKHLQLEVENNYINYNKFVEIKEQFWNEYALYILKKNYKTPTIEKLDGKAILQKVCSRTEIKFDFESWFDQDWKSFMIKEAKLLQNILYEKNSI